MAKIYPISPPQINLEEFQPRLRAVLAIHKPDYFQLRLKDVSETEIIEAVKVLMPSCHDYGVKFILNDNAELAMKLGADGVHIGSDDGDIAKIREIIGNKILGVSCYNDIDRARTAVEAGASYISFGAFYATTTKQVKARAEISTLTQFKSEFPEVEVTAIGGINFENAEPIVRASANHICMISAIWNSSL